MKFKRFLMEGEYQIDAENEEDLGVQYPFGSSQYDDAYDVAKKLIQTKKVTRLNLNSSLKKVKRALIDSLESGELFSFDREYPAEAKKLNKLIGKIEKVQNFKQFFNVAAYCGDYWSICDVIYKALYGKRPRARWSYKTAGLISALMVVSKAFPDLDTMASELQYET